MREIYADGGEGERADCCVRAYATAAKVSYSCAHQLFKKNGRKDRHTTKIWVTRNVIKTTFPEALEQTPGKYTLKWFIDTHPVGHFIIRVRKHMLAVCDGKIYDWNERPSRIIKSYWKLG